MILEKRQVVSGNQFLGSLQAGRYRGKYSPLYLFLYLAYSVYIMDTIKHISYADAHYSYEKDLYTKEYYSHKKDLAQSPTSLHLFSAYGYVENYGNSIIVAFIKKKGIPLLETIKKGEKVIEGLVIPNAALLSNVRTFGHDVLKGTPIGSRVAVTWLDVVHVANLAQYDCSRMYTEGTLYKIENDHIVLKDTETIRTHPLPVKNHPAGKPLWYTIPISLISDIEIIS